MTNLMTINHANFYSTAAVGICMVPTANQKEQLADNIANRRKTTMRYAAMIRSAAKRLENEMGDAYKYSLSNAYNHDADGNGFSINAVFHGDNGDLITYPIHIVLQDDFHRINFVDGALTDARMVTLVGQLMNNLLDHNTNEQMPFQKPARDKVMSTEA